MPDRDGIETPHVYEIRWRKDHRSVDLISDALPFGRLWYGEPHAVIDAIGYVKHYSRSQLVVIRVYDEKSGRANTKKLQLSRRPLRTKA
jgi:hypothetical protein